MLSIEEINRCKALRDSSIKAGDLKKYRKYSAIMAPEVLNLAYKEASKFFGYSVASLYRIRSEFKVMANGANKGLWGGRRKSLLTAREEEKFMEELKDKAAEGGFVDISKIKAGFEVLSNKKVHKTSVYRLLERHGWSKVAPRKYHPKKNEEAQEEFKKKLRIEDRRDLSK